MSEPRHGGTHGGGGRRPKPHKPAKPPFDEDGANWFAVKWHRHLDRRRAKKARIKAMPMRRRVLRRTLILGTWGLGALASVMVVAVVLFYALTDVPRPEDLPLPQVATIQYADGSTLAKIGTVDRTTVHLQDVPATVRWAVLAAEDRGFYDENAVSVRGTLRAALSDIGGGNTQGGSGITQQYVKNAYLSNSQTLSRKLKELMIAVKLTREYSKDQILEFYLNTVYFGRNTYGIQAASEAYFGVGVDKLNTAQGALLAGLLRAPGYYDPAVNLTAAKQRWRYVLDGMVDTKHLTQAQEDALRFPTVKPPRGNGIGTTGWKYLLKNQVMAELQAHGISASEISARGLTIRTTIDPKAQRAALSAISTNFKHLTKKQRNLKNALVAINPTSGGVLAYYGGTGPDVKGNDGKIDFNDYASRGNRPPGSSFKPYVLATVLTQTIKQAEGKPHYTINSQVNGSKCLEIEGTKICNDPGDDSVSSSKISVRKAMKYSLNTTFDLLASEAGPDQVADTAHALGVSVEDSNGQKTLQDKNGSTSFGIGIGDYPVSTMDQASGYATLANGGVRNDPYLVAQVTDSDGNTVYRHKADPQQAVDKRVANDVTLTLKPIAAYSDDGLDGDRQSAAKTGTEGVSGASVNNSDAWMVGFTPQVSAAVWVGSGLSQPIYDANGKPLYGSDLPGKTWKTFMDDYLKGAKKVKLPTKTLIASDGGTPAPTTQAPTPPPTISAPPSDTGKPTFEPSTGFPSTPSAPPSSRTISPPPSRTTTTPTPPSSTCTPAVLQPCPGG
ncbi:transglycosylase domain-containing protein [uncultured Jatrophihabitans sp.]|uniref:transglycosylase domain-containing protein n=1 Tax=uncultured Jatrophihabitans sp. TaxID=1610747 RepID=UPI0035CAE998